MKKLISIVLIVLFSIFNLSACVDSEMGGTPQQGSDTSPDTGTDTTPPSEEPPLEEGDVSSMKVVYDRISWRENMEDTSVIRSVEELQSFYDELKAADINQLNDEVVWRLTGGEYNNNFFANNFLVLITVAESSGSNRHELMSISEDDSVLDIEINRILPFIGTADMAGWLITIELSNDHIAKETNVTFIDVTD